MRRRTTREGRMGRAVVGQGRRPSAPGTVLHPTSPVPGASALTKGRALFLLLALSVSAAPGCGVFRGGSGDPLEWTEGRLREDPVAWSEACATLEAKAAAEPGEPYWPHRRAELELLRGWNGSAEAFLRAALEVDPLYLPSLTRLSALLHEQGRHDEAIEILEPAVAGGAGEEARAALALHEVALGNVDAAESTLAPLEAREDHWRTLGSVLTYVRLHGERYREAPRWAERALEANETAATCNNYGIALLQEGDPEGARRMFLRALELESDLPGPLYNLAIVERFYFFDEDAAEAYYRRFAARSDADPDNLREVFGDAPAGHSSVLGADR